jgi:two-component sensor histidine kinase
VLFDVAKKLGEYVGASRSVFIEVDVARDQAKVHRDYCKGLPSLEGTLRLSSFSPEALAAAAAGRILVTSDTRADAETSKQYEKAYAPAGIRARVAVPLLRGGQYASTLLVSTHEPRRWQQREVALIQTVAERTWVWFEHLGTLEALREREREREALLAQVQELNVSLEQRVEARTADLAATLKEREVLLQEIHHRVKNNLYVIISLMEMQARTMKHSEGRRALEECQGRVHAIALIHEKLYQSQNYAEIPFADYLRGLADEVFHATGVSQSTVGLTLSVADVAITVEKAIPCGLILNELITNALKHAFPGGRSGTVRVELEKADARRLRLAVADDGVGLPPGLNIHDAKSLGLRLVETLASQLDGELKVNGARGTSFELEFPVRS